MNTTNTSDTIAVRETATDLSHWPKPICQQCGKEVETMSIKADGKFYKIEVQCHRGYEMYRIETSAIQNAVTIQQGIAFAY